MVDGQITLAPIRQQTEIRTSILVAADALLSMVALVFVIEVASPEQGVTRLSIAPFAVALVAGGFLLTRVIWRRLRIARRSRQRTTE